MSEEGFRDEHRTDEQGICALDSGVTDWRYAMKKRVPDGTRFY
jgi:hypothetical protein